MVEKKWHGDKVNKEIDKGVMDRLWASGYLVEADAAKNCPVDTGNLRTTIDTEVFEERKATEVSAGRKVAQNGTVVKYAPYVEKGTSRMAAQPFLLPALLANEAKIRKLWGK